MKSKMKRKLICIITIFPVTIISIVVLILMFHNNKTTQIKLKLSSGDVSAKVVNEVNADEQNYDLAPKTLDEVIRNEGASIFEGKVQKIRYMELKVDSCIIPIAVLEVEVNDCIKGDLYPAESVEILTHTNCSISKVADEAKVDSNAIFIAITNDDGERNYFKSGDSKLVLKDIAKYSLPEGQRWLFVENGEDILYDNDFYVEMGKVNSLDEVKYWLKNCGE